MKDRDDEDIGDIIEKTGPLSRLMITEIAVAVLGIINSRDLAANKVIGVQPLLLRIITSG
jgi:hypothetical protein